MRDDTKLNILWEGMGDVNKDIANIENDIAGILPLVPKIPKDYSTTETTTGQKWIDGKDVYGRVFSGTFLEDATPIAFPNVVVDTVIDIRVFSVGGNNIYASVWTGGLSSSVHKDNNTLYVAPQSAQFFNKPFSVYVEYTKPTATREPDVEPETKKATKKKTTKKEEE